MPDPHDDTPGSDADEEHAAERADVDEEQRNVENTPRDAHRTQGREQ